MALKCAFWSKLLFETIFTKLDFKLFKPTATFSTSNYSRTHLHKEFSNFFVDHLAVWDEISVSQCNLTNSKKDTLGEARKKAPGSLGDWWEGKKHDVIHFWYFGRSVAGYRIQISSLSKPVAVWYTSLLENALVGTSIKAADIPSFNINVVWR